MVEEAETDGDLHLRKFFQKYGYVTSSNMMEEEGASYITQYALFEMLNDVGGNRGDPQVPGTYSKYADSLMESLLVKLQPDIEYTSGVKLIPTYSYYRVYKPGDVLEDHKDRPACEISATITLGYKYNGKDPNYRWRLHVYVGGKKRVLNCEIGDVVIYKGCEIEHGRDKFDVDEYSYQVQCFLHYVNVNGPTYTEELKYDRRPSIGFKVKETIVNNDTTDC